VVWLFAYWCLIVLAIESCLCNEIVSLLLRTNSAWCFVNIQEGFAFSHCTTCKAPYYLRVHVHTDRKWRTMKFRFFVTRDILFIFALVQFVSIRESMSLIFCLYVVLSDKSISYSFVQVISALAYLVHFIDGYQQYWLRTAWGFDNEVSFYYICGKLLNHLHLLLSLVP
jgi:hypothetical protein